MARAFGWDSFGWRLLFSLVVVMATYNPAGLSYWHWATDEPLTLTPAKGIVGVALLIGWVMLIRATMRSLGGFGIMLVAALCGFLVWGLVYWGIVSADSLTALQWIGELAVVGILAVGISWSHIRRRVSGQYDVDDIEEG